MDESVSEQTAWQLCGDWWWVDRLKIRVCGGSTCYETATASKSQKTVALRRTEGLRRIVRYVSPDTLMELLPIRD